MTGGGPTGGGGFPRMSREQVEKLCRDTESESVMHKLARDWLDWLDRHEVQSKGGQSG